MSLAPVAERERIVSLDVIRGFAVLGILVVNAAYFAAPWQNAFNPSLPPLGVDGDSLWSWFGMHVFFEQKCITLFSMLFGASIYMIGAERSDKERGAVLRRRLTWLLAIGLVHGLLIWFGDILFAYALTGLLVLLCRSWRPRTLMIVGVLVFALAIAFERMAGLMLSMLPPEEMAAIYAEIWAPPPEELNRIIAAYQAGWLSATQENISSWVWIQANALPILIPRTFGAMLIGMALLKWGFLRGQSPTWLYALMAAIGAGALAVIAWQANAHAADGFTFDDFMGAGGLANVALTIFVSIGYASVLVLLVRAGAKLITGPLAAVGRMAFTNYLTQSLIMTTLFWGGRGFGLFGELDRPSLMGVVAAIWVLQLIWSPLWLSRFEMGPFEWLWRRLSYAAPVRFVRLNA